MSLTTFAHAIIMDGGVMDITRAYYKAVYRQHLIAWLENVIRSLA